MTSAERSARQAPFPDHLVVLKPADHGIPNSMFACLRCGALDHSTRLNENGTEHWALPICTLCIKTDRDGQDA